MRIGLTGGVGSGASEVSNFGFDIYRSDKEEGPFAKINAEVISGAGTSDTPQYYVYEDTDIECDKSYFYYVESISMDGAREQFTPIIKSPPKTRGGKLGKPDAPAKDKES